MCKEEEFFIIIKWWLVSILYFPHVTSTFIFQFCLFVCCKSVFSAAMQLCTVSSCLIQRVIATMRPCWNVSLSVILTWQCLQPILSLHPWVLHQVRCVTYVRLKTEGEMTVVRREKGALFKEKDPSHLILLNENKFIFMAWYGFRTIFIHTFYMTLDLFKV